MSLHFIAKMIKVRDNGWEKSKRFLQIFPFVNVNLNQNLRNSQWRRATCFFMSFAWGKINKKLKN